MDNKKQEQFKKILVFSGLGLIFFLSMWFIFKPSAKADEKEKGLNNEVPQASVKPMPENKLKEYELSDHEQDEQNAREQMGRLSDYFDTSTEDARQDAGEVDASKRKIEQSMQRYEETNKLLSSFYEPDGQEEEKAAMQQEIEELKQQLNRKAQQDEPSEEEKQLHLMEKSYQMAAKYFPKVTSQAALPTAENAASQAAVPLQGGNTTELPQMEVLPARKQVVSSLAGEMEDSVFVKEYALKKRHLGFVSIDNVKGQIPRNTLKVVVDRTTTLTEGQYLTLRLVEDARIHNAVLPRQSRLLAQARIEGNRMQLIVKSIEAQGSIFAVKLSAFDTDGQEGVYIPGMESTEALREIGANVGGSMGTSFTFAQSAKDQIISEAARGVMQGAAQLLQKKLRTVKVTLKGGYRLYLVQSK